MGKRKLLTEQEYQRNLVLQSKDLVRYRDALTKLRVELTTPSGKPDELARLTDQLTRINTRMNKRFNQGRYYELSTYAIRPDDSTDLTRASGLSK